MSPECQKQTSSVKLKERKNPCAIWLRAYWPDQAILDGIWKPPVVKIAN